MGDEFAATADAQSAGTSYQIDATQARLAEIYLDGGRAPDAPSLLRAAADGGHVFSAAQSGAWYILGRRVEADLEKGFCLVERASRGRALWFDNVGPHGSVDRQTLHAGLARPLANSGTSACGSAIRPKDRPRP